MHKRSAVFLASMLFLGCGDDDATPADAGPVDDGGSDAGAPVDSGLDAGTDAGPVPTCTENCELVELALGLEFSCTRRMSGEILCWGSNQQGQLGDGQMRHGSSCPMAEETDFPDCSAPVTNDVANAADMSAQGALSACAIDADGALWCWGLEGVAATAGGTLAKRFVPRRIDLPGAVTDVSDGWSTTCAVVGGEVYCISHNGSGQAGVGHNNEVRTFTKVPDLTEIVDVEVGIFGGFVCARSATEHWCWGSNEYGQFGDARTDHEQCMRSGGGFYQCANTPQSVVPLNDLPDDVTQLALGSRHACALTTAGTVYCWGQGGHGQLGQASGPPPTDSAYTGSNTPLLVPGLTGVTQVTAGLAHTCALLDTGAIKCWGAHDEGQLGDGVAVNAHEGTCNVGTEAYDCTDTPVDVLSIDDATFIEAGGSHNCAIRGTSEVWCWGANEWIQLGLGATGPTARERRTEPAMVVGIP